MASKTIAEKFATISPETRIRELEALVEKQQQQLEKARAAKFVLPTGRQKPSKTNERFTRVIVPDSHGCYIDKEAAAAFLSDLEILRPAEILMLGDHLDCGAFLSENMVLGTVPETDATFEDDVKATNVFLDEIQKRVPGASITYIEGNHEARIERQIIKWSKGNASVAKSIRKVYGPELVLELDKRCIRFIKRSERYDGLSMRGTIDIGNCLARHGKKCGKHAAQATVEQFGCNVVFAHTHRVQVASKATPRGVAYGWSFGCLAQLIPLYYDTDPTDWAHGYGIQAVNPDSGFLTLQVPIIGGKSYLRVLAEGFAA